MHPTPTLIQFFTYEHLRAGEPRDVSAQFCELARAMAARLPSNPEATVALRKLLEAKDAAVRATLWRNGDHQTSAPSTHSNHGRPEEGPTTTAAQVVRHA